MNIAIVGLGYVGLPLSLQFARSGVNVLGLDIDPPKVEATVIEQAKAAGVYVFADSAAAVVMPPGDLEQVLSEARSNKADDARYRAEIARENGPPP